MMNYTHATCPQQIVKYVGKSLQIVMIDVWIIAMRQESSANFFVEGVMFLIDGKKFKV